MFFLTESVMDIEIEMLLDRGRSRNYSVTVFQLQLQYHTTFTVQYTVYVKRSGGRTVRPLRVCFGRE